MLDLSIEGLSQPLLLLLVPLPEEELRHHNQDEDGEESDDNEKAEPIKKLSNRNLGNSYWCLLVCLLLYCTFLDSKFASKTYLSESRFAFLKVLLGS